MTVVVYGDIVCNNAHFVPNLQLPFLKYLHTDDSEVGSGLCEKIQFAPAVQVPCLKNLQGTWDRLDATIYKIREYTLFDLVS